MRSLILSSTLFLMSCATVPVNQTFPEVPVELLEPCPPLMKTKDDETNITEMLKVIVKNYGLYHQCSASQEKWIDWYNKQKDIFNKANK